MLKGFHYPLTVPPAPDVERLLSKLALKRAQRIEEAHRYTENPITSIC